MDHDIDIFNDQRVQWAVGTRCQADRDVTIISNVGGSDLDPSDLKDGVTAKMGIDATAKPRLDTFTPRHSVPKDVFERLDLKDYVPASWLRQKMESVNAPANPPHLSQHGDVARANDVKECQAKTFEIRNSKQIQMTKKHKLQTSWFWFQI